MSRGRFRFHPRMVPEIRKGYYWLVRDQQGFGTTSFRIPEGNKHPTFDLVQPTVASQYTQLFENGQAQARMRKSVDANPSLLGTSAAVQAGWTGPTYIGKWMRLPDASGDVTSVDFGLSHSLSTGNQRRINFNYIVFGGADKLSTTVSEDGLTHATNNPRSSSTMDGTFQWIESMFDPNLVLGGTSPADVIKHYSNFVLQAQTTIPTTAPASLFDASAQIFIACQNATTANTDTTDWSAAYYGNGIPSLKNRKRLANHYSPLLTKFT